MPIDLRSLLPLALLAALLSALVFAAGCATTGGSDGPVEGGRNVITRDQLEGMDHLSAYDAVRRLRPTWLRTSRGTDSLDPRVQARRGVRVYMEGTFLGSASELRSISVQDVEAIRFLPPRQATMEHGTDHPDGALVITIR